MADTLRDRIVAAMKERAERDTDWMLVDLADAVIEALDLGIPCVNDGCRMRQIARCSAEKPGLTGDGE